MINNPFIWGDPYMYDLKWMVQMLHKVENEVKEVYDLQFLNYANPFQWSIANQYKKNTLTLNPSNGNVYLSLKPVPVNTDITDTDYWTLVFNMASSLDTIEDNIGYREDNWTATREYEVNDLVWVYNTLYRVTAETASGDNLRDNTVAVTINDILHDYDNAINELTENVDAEVERLDSKIDAVKDYASIKNLKGANILCIGDSYNSGKGSTDNHGWSYWFERATGATCYHIKNGGMGFVAKANDSVYSDYYDKNIPESITAWRTDHPNTFINMVIIQSGANDATRAGQSLSSVQTNIATTANLIKTYFPSASIMVVPTYAPKTTIHPIEWDILRGIIEGCAKVGIKCISNSIMWFFGETSITASDNVHYTTYQPMGNYIASCACGWDGLIKGKTEELAYSSSYVVSDASTWNNFYHEGANVEVMGSAKMSSIIYNATLMTLPERYRPYTNVFVPVIWQDANNKNWQMIFHISPNGTVTPRLYNNITPATGSGTFLFNFHYIRGVRL